MTKQAISRAMNLTAATYLGALARGVSPEDTIETLSAGLATVFGGNGKFVLSGALVLAENQLVEMGLAPNPTKIGAISAGLRASV